MTVRLLSRRMRDLLYRAPSVRMLGQEVPPLRLIGDAITTVGAWRFTRGEMIPWTPSYFPYRVKMIEKNINDPAVLAAFRLGRLPAHYGYRLDERIVEYPWFFSQLRDDDRRLLDAGSVLNFRFILNASRLATTAITIVTLDREGFVTAPQKVSYLYEDLRSLSLRADHFDVVVSLSTLEHVGLDNTMLYTEDVTNRENNPTSYLAAVDELVRVTKPGGRVLISVPYGKYRDGGWFQVFDAAMIAAIIARCPSCTVTETYFLYRGDQWQFADKESCWDAEYYDVHTTPRRPDDYLAASRAVACLVIQK